ncbi:hypothetical protein EVAR_53623_1 [Eumeta japonica]|uniref:Uncharacterized protein n=1 Tax=Eumeta variegata TaxID=151549 RepID=A0A4C1X2F9_EUMVA|nr:hypothetical protein EVAR_53623_1 [Eumeta japonica]
MSSQPNCELIAWYSFHMLWNRYKFQPTLERRNEINQTRKKRHRSSTLRRAHECPRRFVKFIILFVLFICAAGRLWRGVACDKFDDAAPAPPGCPDATLQRFQTRPRRTAAPWIPFCGGRRAASAPPDVFIRGSNEP